MTFLDRLTYWLKEQPQAPFLLSENSILTYQRFFDQAQGVKTQLQKNGIPPGSRVAILSQDYPSGMSAVVGCWLGGYTAVPLNVKAPLAQRMGWVKRAGCVALLGTETESELKTAVTTRHNAEIECTEDLIFFTSGTTGISKGVRIHLDRLFCNAEAAARFLSLCPADRVFLNTPPYFTSGLLHFLSVLSAGASLVTRSGFYFGASILSEMDATSCTGFGGAPTHFLRVVESALSQRMPPTVRFWMSSGDHLPESAIRMGLERFPDLDIFTVYGLTEVSGRLCMHHVNRNPRKLGSVGQPIGNMKVFVEKSEGISCKPKEVGEVVIAGPLLMEGYLNEKPISSTFRTGDWGYLDEDNFLWLQGRQDDLFKCGAEKVSTYKIQEALLATGMCLEAAVMAKEDSLLGKVPWAYIVPKPNFNKKVLLQKLRKVLSLSHMPKNISLVQEIPRTGSGKVLRSQLPALG